MLSHGKVLFAENLNAQQKIRKKLLKEEIR